MYDLSVWTVVLLCVAAAAAGWVDAVSGGGGMVQLPALFIALPAGAEVNALATNKLSSIFGTATAARTYVKNLSPDWKTVLPMAGAACAFSAMGAWTAHLVPTKLFANFVIVALISVWLWTLFSPVLGSVDNLRWHGSRKHLVVAVLVSAIIGFYDGIFGPGTGSFLLIALVGLLGYSFLMASSTAKIVNLGTNAAALVIFGMTGSVLWLLGLLLALFNVLGAYVGARTAIARGSAFVRTVFLAVVALLIIRLIWDTWVP
ncbi:MAG: TSUP family transporter [Candidatus Nanopelagicales bacterium]|nr:TSUP family transporter [Candidatus Nanopelagicales bacterium]MCF8538700.1 TSUP family transporter [Candidatus Nanopelagicales bacterium]MCF8550819.1 TSUP family transporter [Candidatus Nanopelagicales bacterium]